MLFSIIPLKSLTVSAVSNTNSWVEVFSEIANGITIKFYQNDVKQGIKYSSQVKITINGQQKYITKTYSRYLWGFYTTKDICNKDSKLKRAKVWNYIENIQELRMKHNVIVDVMENYSYNKVNNYVLKDFNKKVRETTEGYCKDIAKDATLKKLGIKVPSSYKLANDVISWVKDAMGFSIFWDIIDIWGYQAKKALGIAEATSKIETQYSNKIKWEMRYLSDAIGRLR